MRSPCNVRLGGGPGQAPNRFWLIMCNVNAMSSMCLFVCFPKGKIKAPGRGSSRSFWLVPRVE